MKRTENQKTGTARMSELGYKPIQLWLPPTLFRELKTLALADDKPATRYAVELIAVHIAQQKRSQRPSTHAASATPTDEPSSSRRGTARK